MVAGKKQSGQSRQGEMLERKSDTKRGQDAGEHGVFDRNPHQRKRENDNGR